jgi:hypothetical protein
MGKSIRLTTATRKELIHMTCKKTQNIKETELKYLQLIKKCYDENGKFTCKELYDVMAEDIVWDSTWRFDNIKGKDEVYKHLDNKKSLDGKSLLSTQLIELQDCWFGYNYGLLFETDDNKESVAIVIKINDCHKIVEYSVLLPSLLSGIPIFTFTAPQ